MAKVGFVCEKAKRNYETEVVNNYFGNRNKCLSSKVTRSKFTQSKASIKPNLYKLLDFLLKHLSTYYFNTYFPTFAITIYS